MLFLCLLLAQTSIASAALDALTPQQWQDDLDSLFSQMKTRHMRLYNKTPAKTFERAVEALHAEIPKLNADQIVVRFARLAALAGDGHSGILDFPEGNTFYPIRLVSFSDGIFVERATQINQPLAGARLVAINGVPVERVYDLMSEIVPHDPGNLGLVRRFAPVLMASSNVLHGLGIAKSSAEASFRFDRHGKQVDVVLKPEVPVSTLFGWATPDGWVSMRKPGALPLWLQNPEENWVTYLPDKHVEYVHFRQVLDEPKMTLAGFSESVLTSIDKNGPEALVIDVRMNNGGNNALLAPLLNGIRDRPFINTRPHLFIVTGPITFSAAQNFVNRVQLVAKPIFVGEPTGENVNMYGDPSYFELPNSHLHFGMATRFWNDLPDAKTQAATIPDIYAPLTSDEYARNWDPALEAILRYGVGVNGQFDLNCRDHQNRFLN